jgi:hypothetical protein
MRLLARIGRRGSYLLFLALVDVLYGYSLLVYMGPSYPRLDLFFSAHTWGWIWIIAGLFIAQQAFTRVDRLGFVVAVVIKFVWGAIAFYDFILNPHHDPLGWVSAVIWFGFGALTAIVSYWPEHTTPQIGGFDDEDE